MGLEGTALSREASLGFLHMEMALLFYSVLPRKIQFCALCQ